jgi:ankyrin repeat protein
MATSNNVFEAIVNCDLERLKTLIADEPRLASARNEAGVSALMTAAYHRNALLVELLIQAIPDLDIFEATSVGDLSRLKTLLNQPGTVNSRSPDGFSPLHFAAFFNHPEAARTLIAAGADIAAVAENPSRVQPLHSAAASRAIEVVRPLLQYGADPNAKQQGGWTALQSAAKHGDLQMIDLLLQHGGNPNQTAENGETAISLACNDVVRRRLEMPNA